MQIITRILSTLLLLTAFYVSSPALAQESAPPANPLTTEEMKASLNPANMSPYSAKQYATIFGCPGGFFGGDCGTTAFGLVAGQFNLIAMIMGVIVLGYVVVGGAINTAASGEILGRNWSSAWIPIRTTMAFGLILPLASTAPYSPAQMATLYAVVVGDNLATTAVKNVASKVASGEITAGAQTPTAPRSISLDIAGSVFCAANEWNTLTANGTKNTDAALFYVVDGNGITKKTGKDNYSADYSSLKEIRFGSSGACGSMKFQTASILADIPLLGKAFDSSNRASAFAAANAVVIEEMNQYAALESLMRADKNTSVILDAYYYTSEQLPEPVVNKIKEYETAVQTRVKTLPRRIAAALSSGYGDIDAKEFLKRDVVHYTDINKLLHKMAVYSSGPTETANAFNSSISNPNWGTCFSNSEGCEKKVANKSIREMTAGLDSSSTMPGLILVQVAIQNSPSLSGAGNASSLESTVDLSEDDIFSAALNPSKLLDFMADKVRNIILGAINVAAYGGSYLSGGESNAGDTVTNMNFTLNPLVYLHNIGHAMLALCTVIIVALMGAGAAAEGLKSSFVTSLFGGGAVSGALSVFLVFVTPVVYTLVMAGLGFLFVSLIPIIVGIYAYLSIIVMAIQGVCSAPFAVVLLTSPEGHGGTNQTAQRFLLHLTHLMLAPMIYVVGALASVVLIIVGANIVIGALVVDMSFFGAGSWIVSLGSVLVFVWLLYKLIHKTAMFQIQMQNDVMEILGGAFHKPMGGDMAGEAFGALNTLGNSAQKGMQTAMGRAMDAQSNGLGSHMQPDKGTGGSPQGPNRAGGRR